MSGLGFGRCYRLWSKNDFKLAAQRARKRQKPENPSPRPQQAEYPNHVWTYDILFDRLADGRHFKTLSILDEFTRECLGILVSYSILAQDVITLLTKILSNRPAPAFLRSDNGSEFTAQSVQTWLEQNKVGPVFIPPGQHKLVFHERVSFIYGKAGIARAAWRKNIPRGGKSIADYPKTA